VVSDVVLEDRGRSDGAAAEMLPLTMEIHRDAVSAELLAAHVVEVAVIFYLDSRSAIPLGPFYSKEEDCGLEIAEAEIDLAAGNHGLGCHP
jgi:hypothetical protein